MVKVQQKMVKVQQKMVKVQQKMVKVQHFILLVQMRFAFSFNVWRYADHCIIILVCILKVYIKYVLSI